MLDDETIVLMVRTTLILVLKIGAPMLLAGTAIGLVISVFQSVTSIQDQTLTFVPKIAVMLLVGALLIPWIVEKLIEYAQEMFLLMNS